MPSSRLRRWAIDTSAYTHLCRAGHQHIIERLAPAGVVVVPAEVNDEIERGRASYGNIPAVSSVPWAELAVLSDDEVMTELGVKADMGGGPDQHLGECAVIACCIHRKMTAILDERAAIEQADLRDVPTHDTLWMVIEAHKTLPDYDRARVEQVVDDLLRTGMFLPIDSGASLFAWAYREGLLP